MKNLFKLFGKLEDEKSIEMNKSGVGLGLAISQSLVKILNNNIDDAEIKVFSEINKGSCFYFPLIIQKNDEIDMGPTHEFNDSSDEDMVEKFQLLQRFPGY